MLVAAGLGAGLVLAAPLLLGLEALVAARGDRPPPLASGIDGCVGCDGSSVPLRTVWLGDSTAAGVGASAAEAVLGRQVARRLDRPVEVRVLASSGATVARLRRTTSNAAAAKLIETMAMTV